MSSAAQTPTRTVPAGRDLTLDLVRVACVVLVVFAHILFSGVGRGADGSILIERTVEQQTWFDVASWIADIMPLFFVVGGFAARAGWASSLKRGGTEDEFVRVRLARLARPALPLFVFFTVALGAARMLGIDPALVDTVAIGVGSPLWFLAAYITAQALAPTMMRLHTRYGGRILVVLFAGVVIVDLLRFGLVRGVLGVHSLTPDHYGVGDELAGIPNVLFVWLFCQQVGFFLYDGWFRRRRAWQLIALMAGGYVLAVASVPLMGYSWNMLANQWPPTLPLAILAVVQAAGLTLLHKPLTALTKVRAVQGMMLLIGSRLMTVYLWHLPVVMILIGIELLLPIPMPAPGGALWWWTRVPFLLLVLAVVWLLSIPLARFEKVPPLGAPRLRTATPLAVVLFLLPPLAISAYGLDLPLAAAGLVLTGAALWLTGGFGSRERAVS
ncbi:acyltransferase [Microbacterium sp. NPDC057650]|uniref:acyltransferase family protein n=1 Tax=unclassified Microbacterium TaxID=2609290 RepID=UPI0036734064